MLLCLYDEIIREAKLCQITYKPEVVGEYSIFYSLLVKMDLVIPYTSRKF